MPVRIQKRSPQRRSPVTSPAPASLQLSPLGDGWSLRRTSGIDLLVADALASLPWLVHGFTTRTGGHSKLGAAGVLNAGVLNLGFTDWDSRPCVSQNRGKLLGALAAEHWPLIALRQIHSDMVQVIRNPAQNPEAPSSRASGEETKLPASTPLQGDALLTAQAGLLLAAQTADCVPILLVDAKRRVVAAIHAGWRGTLARIAAKTLGRMRLEFGTRPADVVAAIGPAIGRCCYEVGPEVAQAFLGQFPAAPEWFDGPFDRLAAGEEQPFLPWLSMVPPGHEAPPERVRLDLAAANRWQLADAGIRPRHITVSPLCTACRSDLFFSYRREGAHTGRHMAVIGIRNELASGSRNGLQSHTRQAKKSGSGNRKSTQR